MVNEADKEIRKILSRGNTGSRLTFLISLFILMGAVGNRRFLFLTPSPIIAIFHTAPGKVSGLYYQKNQAKMRTTVPEVISGEN